LHEHVRVRVLTHEVIINSQLASIQKTLNRQVQSEIVLDPRQTKSTIEFAVTDIEIGILKNDLGYNVFVFDGLR
jgi:hypothetical protein